MSVELLTPIIERRLRNVNYFEGRLLTGKDLQDQQKANSEVHNRLGRAVGMGIVEGLEVEEVTSGSPGTEPIVKVKKGLAINAKGQTMELYEDKDILLTRSFAEEEKPGNIFKDCKDLLSASIPNGTGIYILVMSPAAQYSTERAPKSGLQESGQVTGCGNRYIDEGVQFRLLELNVNNLSGISTEIKNKLTTDLLDPNSPVSPVEYQRLSMLRNLIAHLCFGTEEIYEAPPKAPLQKANDISKFNAYGVIKSLVNSDVSIPSNKLSECELPLAVIYWSLDGIGFIDVWSVRRELHEIINPQNSFMYEENYKQAVSKAVFNQFQLHIAQLVDDFSDPRQIKAEDTFYFLPPVGLLKLRIGTKTGLVPDVFFGSIPHRSAPEFIGSLDEFMNQNPQFIDQASTNSIFEESFHYPPINVQKGKISGYEMVWVYYPWQQIDSIKSIGDAALHYLVFTVAHLEPNWHSRYDVARWDRSNYERCKI